MLPATKFATTKVGRYVACIYHLILKYIQVDYSRCIKNDAPNREGNLKP